MLTKSIVKEYQSSEKIHDFSISPQRDYMAFAIYSECMTEIHDIKDGSKITELDLDLPIFTVQWAKNGIHLVYGGSSGSAILCEFSRFKKSLSILHKFENLFSLNSNINAISISGDS